MDNEDKEEPDASATPPPPESQSPEPVVDLEQMDTYIESGTINDTKKEKIHLGCDILPNGLMERSLDHFVSFALHCNCLDWFDKTLKSAENFSHKHKFISLVDVECTAVSSCLLLNIFLVFFWVRTSFTLLDACIWHVGLLSSPPPPPSNCSGIMGQCQVTEKKTREPTNWITYQHFLKTTVVLSLFTYKVLFEFKHPWLFIVNQSPAIRLQVVESPNYLQNGNNNSRTTRSSVWTRNCCWRFNY